MAFMMDDDNHDSVTGFLVSSTTSRARVRAESVATPRPPPRPTVYNPRPERYAQVSNTREFSYMNLEWKLHAESSTKDIKVYRANTNWQVLHGPTRKLELQVKRPQKRVKPNDNLSENDTNIPTEDGKLMQLEVKMVKHANGSWEPQMLYVAPRKSEFCDFPVSDGAFWNCADDHVIPRAQVGISPFSYVTVQELSEGRVPGIPKLVLKRLMARLQALNPGHGFSGNQIIKEYEAIRQEDLKKGVEMYKARMQGLALRVELLGIKNLQDLLLTEPCKSHLRSFMSMEKEQKGASYFAATQIIVCADMLKRFIPFVNLRSHPRIYKIFLKRSLSMTDQSITSKNEARALILEDIAVVNRMGEALLVGGKMIVNFLGSGKDLVTALERMNFRLVAENLKPMTMQVSGHRRIMDAVAIDVFPPTRKVKVGLKFDAEENFSQLRQLLARRGAETMYNKGLVLAERFPRSAAVGETAWATHMTEMLALNETERLEQVALNLTLRPGGRQAKTLVLDSFEHILRSTATEYIEGRTTVTLKQLLAMHEVSKFIRATNSKFRFTTLWACVRHAVQANPVLTWARATTETMDRFKA